MAVIGTWLALGFDRQLFGRLDQHVQGGLSAGSALDRLNAAAKPAELSANIIAASFLDKRGQW